MSPLFFFDLRHNWMNAKAMYQFFTVRQTTVSIKPWTAIPGLYPQFSEIMQRLVGGQNVLAGEIAAILAIVAMVFILVANIKKLKELNPAYYLIALWLGFGVLGLGLYKQHIYDHYFGFLFPVLFMLMAYFISKLPKFLAIPLFLSLTIFSFPTLQISLKFL